MKKTEQINVRIAEDSLAMLAGENNKDKIDIWTLIPDKVERERRLSIYLDQEKDMYEDPRMQGTSKQVTIRVTQRQKDEVEYLATKYNITVSDVMWILAKEGQYTQEQYDACYGKKGKKKRKRKKHKKLNSITSIPGMKNKRPVQDHMKNIISILENNHDTQNIEVCAGGLGLQPTFNYEKSEDVTWQINDFNSSFVNLYKVVCNQPFSLFACCEKVNDYVNQPNNLSVKLNTAEKEELKKNIKEHLIGNFQSKNKENIINAAITMFFEYYPRADITIRNYLRNFKEKMESIHDISELMNQMKECSFSNQNLLDLIDMYSKCKEIILWIDPPYLFTNGQYEKNGLTQKDHTRIVKKLMKADCKWIMFCRTECCKQNGYKSNNKKKDDILKDLYGTIFEGKDFYYIDWTLNHTNERIITNFPFPGCKQF